MWQSKFTATRPIANQLVLKKSKIQSTSKTICKKISVKVSVAKPSVKPLPGYTTLWLEPEIHFYKIKDVDKTEKGYEAEILVVRDSILAVSKQKLVKGKFPYIDTFDHEGPAVLITIYDLNSEVFENIELTSPMKCTKGLPTCSTS